MRWLALAAAVVLALPAAAQHMHHEGGGVAAAPASVLVDVADSDVVAGQPVTFTVLLLDGAGLPLAHQDMRIRATFAGTVLFEAPAGTGHDYDGLNEVTLAFPSPGPYAVELLEAGGAPIAQAKGWAVERPREPASAHLEGPAAATVGVPQEYRVWPAASNGSFVKHFYTLFEAWDGEGLALQAKLHGHNDDQVNQSVVQLGFPHAGRWLLRAHLFQAATYGPQLFSFSPLVAELAVDVTGGEAAPMPAESTALSWQVRNGTEPKALVATVDPQPEVGRPTPAHVTVRAQGENGTMRTHVDFAGTLTDAAGRVLFASEHLHESDGLLQVLLRPGVPGGYTWSTVADGNGTRVDVPFRVLAAAAQPPANATATAALPAFTMGQPGAAELSLRDAQGAPLEHGEATLEVLDDGGRVQLAAKLHAHGGAAPFTLAPLDAGPHTLRVQPYALGAEDAPAAALEVAFDVAPGAPWPVQAKPSVTVSPDETRAPDVEILPPLAWRAAATVAVVGLALAGSLAAWRRTR